MLKYLVSEKAYEEVFFMKNKLKIIFVLLFLGCFLFFQTFLVIEKYHHCDEEGCMICEVIEEANREEKTFVSSSTIIKITLTQLFFIPFILLFKENISRKETPIYLHNRMNN